ncbi:MAG: hypothetical protein QW727_00225 [Candidatus Pacearchaeota archaeon]
MVFGWFFKSNSKNEIENVKDEIKNSFKNVKDDINKISRWIGHFHEKHDSHEKEFLIIKNELSSVKIEFEELKEAISLILENQPKYLFKQPLRRLNKQTAVYPVQTAVQTAVQTPKFYGISNLSITERAIVWLIANSELKLSYEDIAAMLGKTKTTIRGQINSIKQKSEGLIKEVIEKNGLKRLYMPEEIKEKILKKTKVRVKRDKK